jgi:hypothetical protein
MLGLLDHLFINPLQPLHRYKCKAHIVCDPPGEARLIELFDDEQSPRGTMKQRTFSISSELFEEARTHDYIAKATQFGEPSEHRFVITNKGVRKLLELKEKDFERAKNFLP